MSHTTSKEGDSASNGDKCGSEAESVSVDVLTSQVEGLTTDTSGSVADVQQQETKNADEADTFPFRITGRSTYRRGEGAGEIAAEVIDDRFLRSTADLDTYKFTHSRRGEAIIISNRYFQAQLGMDERRGTDRDADNLYDTFQLLGFDVKKFNNLGRKQTEAIIKSAVMSDHSDADCFALAVLSHGDDGIIYSTDDQMQISELTEPFRADECHTLAGKPKLFFFQACRGHKFDSGKDVTDSELYDEVDALRTQRIPVMADFLLAYSVIPGYYSWRNSEHGSWFVQSLCHVLRRYHQRQDLLGMMTRVNRHVAFDFQSNASSREMTGKKQIPSIVSMLTKDVWFVSKPQ